MLDVAHGYNANLPNGPLRDPFAVGPDGKPIEIGEGRQSYQDALNPQGDGIMATISIPKIDVSLPIYHGTSEHSLDNGVGHLYGSGLPVGGEGVHSVLTAHSGLVGSKLFSDVHTLELGDTFTISVAGEILTYKIDDIRTVLPDELQALRQVAGKDYVTLVTCTPIGINTHRLLVRGVRIPTPDGAADEIASNNAIRFPWWGLPTPAAALLLAFGTRPLAPLLNGTSHNRSAPRFRLVFSYRAARSKDLAAWKSQHKRVVRLIPAQEQPTGRLRSIDVTRALGTIPNAQGVYTWALYRDEECVGISVFAYPNEMLARQDASWAMRLRTLRGLRPARRPGRAYWLIGLSGVPLMMPAQRRAVKSKTAIRSAERMAGMLSQAELDRTGFGYKTQDFPWFAQPLAVAGQSDERGEHSSP